MRDKVFFDTNIIVYFFDKSEKVKHQQAKEILIASFENTIPYISTQVVNEFIVIASQKIENPIPLHHIKKNLDFLRMSLNVYTIDSEISLKAIDLSLSYDISFWDSLIVASALKNDCSILYSEDMQHGQIIEKKLRIINPFQRTTKNQMKQMDQKNQSNQSNSMTQ